MYVGKWLRSTFWTEPHHCCPCGYTVALNCLKAKAALGASICTVVHLLVCVKEGVKLPAGHGSI
jgi:hypothetical protein